MYVDKLKSDLIEILGDPNAEDRVYFDKVEWGWTLSDSAYNYNFEVVIDRDDRIHLVVHNNIEGVEVCALRDATPDQVIEKARTLMGDILHS